jgi:hypothetical protein
MKDYNFGMVPFSPNEITLPPPITPNLLIDNDGNFLVDNDGNFLIEDFN